ncbi:MAG: hypothetical protein M0P34_00080 [Desulfocurvus sp.]|nr:hypothetical protein [Desulfocurvus sp.]
MRMIRVNQGRQEEDQSKKITPQILIPETNFDIIYGIMAAMSNRIELHHLEMTLLSK